MQEKYVNKEKKMYLASFIIGFLHDLKTRNSTYWEHFQEPQSLADDESGKH